MKAEEKKVEAIPAAEGRGRSTIEFPYLDLENAIEIAQGVHDVGGTGCDWDQLAAHLKQAAQGGGFRLRMICAKQFGLATYDRGRIALTSLGLRAVDPQQAKGALIDAFLTIPLYKAIYDKFRGTTLPPIAGLEREMQTLGVSAKQTDKARQAFARSAKFAGFFDFGSDRLVIPKASNQVGASEGAKAGESSRLSDRQRIGDGGGGGNGGGDGPQIPSAILGLLQSLPAPGTTMKRNRRDALIAAFTATVGYLYPADDDQDSPEDPTDPINPTNPTKG
jgi:hypothetical protein